MIEKRKNKNYYGENFVAPDGDWGWIVCISSGLISVVCVPIRQTFGLIFREQFHDLGITNSQITTIINSQQAFASFTGLIHGPLYRTFTIRLVCVVSAIIIVLGIFMSAFFTTFAGYFLSYSVIYGIGNGIIKSATFLSLNMYFNKNRRRAHSLTLTISAISPIVTPYIVNILLRHYDVQKTVMIFGCVAMLAIIMGFLNEPADWHSKSPLNEIIMDSKKIETTDDTIKNKSDKKVIEPEGHIAVSRYTTIDIIDNKLENLNENTNYTKEKYSTINKCEKIIEKVILHQDKPINDNHTLIKSFNCCIRFFDLDLLNDLKFISLIIGLALTTFAELNLNSLTPFFLADFGFNNDQIAFAMSMQAIMEICVRFSISFLTVKISWSNRVFFMIGIVGTILSRIGIALNPSYNILLALICTSGASRALRSVFFGLIIPDCIPLVKLPPAQGLQLLSTGAFTLIFGPFVGILRDSTNYTYVLYVLSGISGITLLFWTIEIYFRNLKESVNIKNEDIEINK